MNILDVLDQDLIASVLRALVPILLAALGGMICERVGIFNIGLEGIILVGAFAGVAASFFTSNWVAGVIIAMLAGMLFSLILGYGTVYRSGDPIVLAVAMNIFAIGLTSFLLVAIFNVQGVFKDPGIVGIPTWRIPGLADTPWIGPVFDLTPLGYLALLLVPISWVVLFRSPLGLRLRGVGERPLAAATMGVNPQLYQLWAVLASGALAGLGGAQLALGNVVQFNEGMSAGRGWIAVVAVMLARAHPVGVLLAALLFGFTDAVGFRLQAFGLPQQLTDVMPYLVTLIVLIIMSRRFLQARKAQVA